MIAWMVFALVRRRVALAGHLDRERAASSLREHHVGVYLVLDEYARRARRVLSAHPQGEVRRALFDLSPSLVDTTQRAVRHVVLIVVTGAYVVFSLVLALILSLSVLLEGVSTSATSCDGFGLGLSGNH